MARVFLEWPVPKKSIEKYGLKCYHIRLGVVGLWLRWMWWGICNDNMTWKTTKQLAKQGELMTQKWFVLCPCPFHTNFYYLK